MSSSFYETYACLLEGLLDGGHVETNQRTGVSIRVGLPTSFIVPLQSRMLPICGVRKTFPKSAAAEVAWFLQGEKSVKFIKGYAPLWDKFVEDDGDTVAGAYGYRWRNHFGRDQIALAIDALAANPSDRRIFISAWDPGLDGLGVPSKNVPCPVGFTLSVTAGKLNSTLLIRSSDVFVGLPYDVMGHALLMDAIQASLTLLNPDIKGLGEMQVSLAHPHLYAVHEQMAENALSSDQHSTDSIVLPGWGVKRIVSIPHAYVTLVTERQIMMKQPGYSCRPEVVL